MPKHKHHSKEKNHHSRGHSRESRDDRHSSRGDRRDSDRGGRHQNQDHGGRNRNDYNDRGRSRDRERSRESGSGGGGNSGRYDRGNNSRQSNNGGGNSSSDRNRDRGNGNSAHQRQSFPKGNYSGPGNNRGGGGYGYGPPNQPPHPGSVPPPPFGGFGGAGGMPLLPMMGMPPAGFFPPGYPVPNQFSPHMHDGRRGGGFRGGDDRSRKRDREEDFPRGSHSSHSSSSRPDWEHSKRPRYDQDGQLYSHRDMQEEMRVTVSQHAPNKQFLEEVELAPEYAFRVDTRPNINHLRYSSLNLNNASRFEPTYRRDDIFGASEEELSSLLPFRSVFSRCVRPVGIDDDGNPVDEDGNLLDEDGKPMSFLNEDEKAAAVAAAKNNKPKKSKRKHAPLVASSFISFEKPKLKISASSKETAIEPRYQIQKEKSINIRDQVESYNVELRKDPKNIELWRKFIKFQDQVLEHEADEFGCGIHNDREKLGKKQKTKKTNKKALAEKKIAILDRALEANPKNLDLHSDRMNLLYEIFKPRYVLGEWRKLVTAYQQLAPFWDEYLRFSATQLPLYSSSGIIGTFEKSFQKFRLMLNPHYPKFQRPEKFLLLISDLMFGLGLVLRNSGFFEKAIALHQAQCEVNFNFPKELVSSEKDKPIDWDSVSSVFELFWDAGTHRFGESASAPGWAEFIKNKQDIERIVLGVSGKQMQKWEDLYFDTTNLESEKNEHSAVPKLDMLKTCAHWVKLESFRSVCQWLPWRNNSSDIEASDGEHRIVLANELIPFLTLIPEPISATSSSAEEAPFITNFDRNSAYFRTVMNFLLLLQEDFLPHTQTMDSILSSFLPISLNKTNTFFSEIYYWKTHQNLFMSKGAEEDKIVIPDGFSLPDFVSPGQPLKKVTEVSNSVPETDPSAEESKATPNLLTEMETDAEAVPKKVDDVKEETEVEKTLHGLLKSNYEKYDGMLRTIVEKSVDKLDAKFASILAQSYLRFEQRNTYYDEDIGTSPGGSAAVHKSRMKFAKSLLQNEKLRNSIPLYAEMALLEYYGSKNKTKANGILVKAINSTSENLRSKFVGIETGQGPNESEVISNWEIISEVTRLHRLLAELNLNNSGGNCKNVSVRILAALGNNFQGVHFPLDEDAEDFSTNEMLIARRQFEKVYAILFPGDSDSSKGKNKANNPTETDDIVNLWDGNKSVDFLVQNTNFIVEWISSFALFLYLSTDFASASELFTKVLKKVSGPSLNKSTKYMSNIVSISNIREQLYLMWCKIGIIEIEKNPTQNAKFRSILVEALTEFPASPPLLLIFTDVEKQSSIAGKIWRLMTGTIKNESSVSSLHWAPLFMALGLARKVDELRHDEEVGLPSFGLGGPAVPPDTIFYKLDAVLTTAEQNPASRNCPLIWRIHLNLIADRSKRSKLSKDTQTARQMFYEAVRNCPSMKILYMDALTYFPETPSRESEIQQLMSEKGMCVRFVVDELNLLLEKEVDDDDVIEGDEDDDDVVEEDEDDDENENDAEGDVSAEKIDSDEGSDDEKKVDDEDVEMIEEKRDTGRDTKKKNTRNQRRKKIKMSKKSSGKEIENLPSASNSAISKPEEEVSVIEESMSEGEIGE